jgi:HAD superfamily hydrolase (TIGR01484 family)
MHYVVLATDYDGTIAHDGVVDDATLSALARLRHAAHRLVLVTGRELDDLIRVMPQLDLFNLVVAENAALEAGDVLMVTRLDRLALVGRPNGVLPRCCHAQGRTAT